MANFQRFYFTARQTAYFAAAHDFIMLFVTLFTAVLMKGDLAIQVQQLQLATLAEGAVYGRLPVDQSDFLAVMVHSCWPVFTSFLVVGFIMAECLVTGLGRKRVGLLVGWLAFHCFALASLLIIAILSSTMAKTPCKAFVAMFIGVTINRILIMGVVGRVIQEFLNEAAAVRRGIAMINEVNSNKDDAAPSSGSAAADLDTKSVDSGNDMSEPDVYDDGYLNMYEYDLDTIIVEFSKTEKKYLDNVANESEYDAEPESGIKIIPSVGAETPV